ncbi:MAG: 23S rRNA (pseudouridine(1915)-N(3))-methyltransferase RlmH [Caulobacteraceae bacterium]|nr:23S rRNA (pseudouridine(1915)-N(3))-methyltransferase RlmH [Caulobacter sp.]
MRVTVAAVGRLGRAPEAELARDWCARATAPGRVLGLGPFEIAEVEARKPGKAAEAEALRAAVGEAALVIACDERGRAYGSRDFAAKLAGWRDAGERRAVFLIGGADGLDPALRDAARDRLAFGPQTWPHALVRAMLCEQLYRAVTLLAGSPYHRD